MITGIGSVISYEPATVWPAVVQVPKPVVFSFPLSLSHGLTVGSQYMQNRLPMGLAPTSTIADTAQKDWMRTAHVNLKLRTRIS